MIFCNIYYVVYCEKYHSVVHVFYNCMSVNFYKGSVIYIEKEHV
jgi:hypothetical protein